MTDRLLAVASGFAGGALVMTGLWLARHTTPAQIVRALRTCMGWLRDAPHGEILAQNGAEANFVETFYDPALVDDGPRIRFMDAFGADHD